jgi:hypothetical protein
MRERDIDIVVKAWLAIVSSRTREQLETARRYADLACGRLSDDVAAASSRLVMAMTASRQQVRIGRRVEMRRAEIVNLGQVA